MKYQVLQKQAMNRNIIKRILASKQFLQRIWGRTWSFDGTYRFQNEKQLMRYITAAKDTSVATSYKERISPAQERFEIIMLGLRTMQG